jgi:hypothetical protein
MRNISKLSTHFLLVSLHFICCLIINIIVPTAASTPAENTGNALEVESLRSFLKNTSYDRNIPPSSNSTTYTLTFNLITIDGIDDINEEVRLSVRCNFEWKDSRIEGFTNSSTAVRLQEELVYMPFVLFYTFGLREHNVEEKDVKVHIYRDGSVVKDELFTIGLPCPIQFNHYPLDEHNCDLNVSAFPQEIHLEHLELKVDKVKFAQPSYYLMSNKEDDDSFAYSYTVDGGSPNNGITKTVFKLKIKRRYGLHIVQIYIPCAIIVIVSWASFWLGRNLIEARVGLAVTTLLTVRNQIEILSKFLRPDSPFWKFNCWSY